MIHWQRDIRGVPLWLLREYLLELGGCPSPDGGVFGEGWRARLHALEDYRLGSLRVAQVAVELEALPDVWERLRPSLEEKLMRAGG